MVNPSERVRRALLFMPGDDWKKIGKGAALNVDSIIMDLEDGVALTQKSAARETVAKALSPGEIDFGRSERLVRLNSLASGLCFDDLYATFRAKPDGYMLPKVESANDVLEVSNRIAHLESAAKVESNSVTLIALIETALGIVNLKEIASADNRVAALAFGAEDLAASIGAVRSPSGEEVSYARQSLVIHAAAYNLQALDSPCIDLTDPAQLQRETTSAVQLGYTGKLAIHPAQVEPIQTAFTPTDEAIEHARALIAAHDAHQSSGQGVFAFEGKMIDQPLIRAAEHILAKARAAGKL